MGYGKRELKSERNNSKKLNWTKVILAVFVIILAILSGIFLIKNINKKDNINKENQGIAEEIKKEQNQENEFKSIDKMLDEFGGEILEQVNSDTYYINKDGITYTAYVNDEIVEGKIVPWSGEAKQPAVDEAGNINIYTAEELKWIADQVINGEKNFSGVTITLRQNIDLSGRKNEDGKWDGKQWTPIIGFLDELPNKEENTTQQQPVEDDSVNIINENLKRFAGIFDGNGFSIRGLYINVSKRYQGLFGISSGIIQNLTIKNSCINGSIGTGAIVGLNNGKLVNCRINNTEVTGTSKTGGIIGIAMSTSYIENCVSSDNCIISGGDYTGGLIGYVNNNSSIRMCENESIISGNNFVGGISGVAFYGTSIENSVNRSNCIIGEKYVAGIVGYSQAQIEKCTNMTLKEDGYIKAASYVGGITGINYSMGNIESSLNSAKIIITDDNGGGITGVNNANISSCYNRGIIDASNCIGIKIGGICGQNISDSYINSSYNVGKINFKESADGIVGADFGTITDCYYLDSSISIKNDKYIKTSEELKSTVLNNLNESYKEDKENINLGYPILNWEVSE